MALTRDQPEVDPRPTKAVLEYVCQYGIELLVIFHLTVELIQLFRVRIFGKKKNMFIIKK